MKITKRQLKRIIKEEKQKLIRESHYMDEDGELVAEELYSTLQNAQDVLGPNMLLQLLEDFMETLQGY